MTSAGGVSGQALAQRAGLAARSCSCVFPLPSHNIWLEAAMTVTVATLGFPRVGPRRELKTALESYRSGKIPR